MELALLSVLAGVITVLSPCILPLLPVILTGSLTDKSKAAPFVIIGSSAISIIVFTLLLKGTAMFIGVPLSFWMAFSGTLIFFIGLTLVFPEIWERLMHFLRFKQKTSELTAKADQTTGHSKNVLLGLSLGPVFTSCSPTYGIIVAAVLPANFALGALYVTSYALGLAVVLIAIALGGQRIVQRLSWFTKPGFRKVLGIILIITGLAIATGVIKEFEVWLVELGIDLTQFEWDLIDPRSRQ